jgi:hypothetical protein
VCVLTRHITRDEGQIDGDVSKPISQREDRVYPKARTAPDLEQVLQRQKRKLHHITGRGPSLAGIQDAVMQSSRSVFSEP